MLFAQATTAAFYATLAVVCALPHSDLATVPKPNIATVATITNQNAARGLITSTIRTTEIFTDVHCMSSGMVSCPESLQVPVTYSTVLNFVTVATPTETPSDSATLLSTTMKTTEVFTETVCQSSASASCPESLYVTVTYSTVLNLVTIATPTAGPSGSATLLVASLRTTEAFTETVCQLAALASCPKSLQIPVTYSTVLNLVTVMTPSAASTFSATGLGTIESNAPFEDEAKDVLFSSSTPSTEPIAEATQMGENWFESDTKISNKVILGVGLGVALPVLIAFTAMLFVLSSRRKYAAVPMAEGGNSGNRSNPMPKDRSNHISGAQQPLIPEPYHGSGYDPYQSPESSGVSQVTH